MTTTTTDPFAEVVLLIDSQHGRMLTERHNERRTLERQYGVSIVLSTTTACDADNQQRIHILGHRSAMPLAVAELQARLNRYKNERSVRVAIPNDYVARLIGRHGAVVDDIRHDSGADIRSPGRNKSNSTPYELFIVRGLPKEINIALDIIAEKLYRYSGGTKVNQEENPTESEKTEPPKSSDSPLDWGQEESSTRISDTAMYDAFGEDGSAQSTDGGAPIIKQAAPLHLYGPDFDDGDDDEEEWFPFG